MGGGGGGAFILQLNITLKCLYSNGSLPNSLITKLYL